MDKQKQTIREAYQAILAALAWLNSFGEHAPIVFGGEEQMHVQLNEARLHMEEEWPFLEVINPPCSKCGKPDASGFCRGCSKYFCGQHFLEHQQDNMDAAMQKSK